MLAVRFMHNPWYYGGKTATMYSVVFMWKKGEKLAPV